MDADTHFATPNLRRLRRIVRSADGATSYEETVLQQKYLPIFAGQGREEEWRDVPVVDEELAIGAGR